MALGPREKCLPELVREGSPRLPHPAAHQWQTCPSGTDAAVLTARAALCPEATLRTGAGVPSNGASPTDMHTPTAGCLPSAASHLTMPAAGWGLGQTTTGRGMGPTLGREPQDSSCLSVSPKQAREQPGSRPPASQGKGTYWCLYSERRRVKGKGVGGSRRSACPALGHETCSSGHKHQPGSVRLPCAMWTGAEVLGARTARRVRAWPHLPAISSAVKQRRTSLQPCGRRDDARPSSQ